MEKFFIELIEANKKYGKHKVPYKNDEEVFGLVPAIGLVRRSKKYCKLYGEFLKTLYMDHEVYESALIYEAFSLYGCSEETLSLLAVRLFPASGQHGSEDFDFFIENYPIEQYLGDKDNFDSFLKSL